MESRHEAGEHGRVIVLMGVSGSGKTTVGRLLAATLDWDYCDADDYHPASNVAKMAAGIPLSDADRLPWLHRLSGMIDHWVTTGQCVVLGCSALKEHYRRCLGVHRQNVSLVYLQGSRELIERRLAERRHRYMPASLLASQFEALEEPADAVTVSIEPGPNVVVQDIIGRLQVAPST